MQRGAASVIEIVAVVIDDEVEHGALRKLGRLIEHKPPIADFGLHCHAASMIIGDAVGK